MNIEIWSDIACPFCLIGKSRLENAIAQLPEGKSISLTYRSFELDPYAEKIYNGTITQLLSQKYNISVAQAEEMNAGIAVQGKLENFNFNFDKMLVANTFDAHQFLHWAKTKGKEHIAIQRLFEAYFTNGELISNHEVLSEIAEEIGLPGDEALHILQNNTFAQAVKNDELYAKRMNINAVPFVLIDGTIAIRGAQSVEVFK
ncbi:MAG: DsbA family oxidoreductase, partial [Bacilli bacterium]